MRDGLPGTPAEVLDLSTRALRFKVGAAVKAAEILGHWRHPSPQAATAFEEMTLKDIYYWVYKSRNPITRMENGIRPEDVFVTDSRTVAVPVGFVPTTSANLGAAGDLLQADGLEHAKDRLFEPVADLLFDRTLSYANFESPVTTQALRKEVIGDREAPVECCSRTQFDALKGHGAKCFTVLNTANNHMFDMGPEGLDTTRKALLDNGILGVGTIEAPEDFGKARIVVANGIRIGFATVTFGLNGHALPPGEEHRIYVSRLLSKVAPPDLDLLKRQIDHCKAEACDFVIASLHWGYEFELFPRLRQVEIARELVEWGADTIICHHPHVIQPVEYYRTRRDPNRIAVIAYSLGSLVWGFRAPHLALSAILNLTIAKGCLREETVTYLQTASVTPVFQNTTTHGGERVTRIERLSDHQGGKGDAASRQHVATMRRYADLVLGPQA